MKITLQARNDKFEENTYNIIKKYKCYAQTCEDPALKEMCEDMAQRHTQHYDAILSELK